MPQTAIATLSSKNQITLPAAMVRRLNLRPGDKLELRLVDSKVTLERQPRTPDEWAARFSGVLKDRPYWRTKEEIDEYIEQERQSWEDRDKQLGL